MSVLAPAPPERPAWMPARFSPPLVAGFPSHGDWLLRLVDLVWRLPDGSPIDLDPWQRWLIRAALEVYPDGHPRAGELRYRQVLISVSRQNGKSVLGAIFGLYGLVREAGALVIGIASSAEQARIIYARLLSVIRGNRQLAARFKRLTDTRGIQSVDGGRYEIKPSKSAAVQGLDLTVGLADELHLTKRELWSDMVNGTAARRNGIVIGLTTAGDETSELLIDLYGIADDPPERFGFFIWEAPEARVPADDETLGRYLVAASPGLACGRLDLETAISDVRGMAEADVIRYRLNRFTSSTNAFITATLWASRRRRTGEFPAGRAIFAIDRTPDWGFASIVATVKAGELTAAELVASIAKPTLSQLVNVCVDLARHQPLTFAMDGYALKDLGAELKKRGLPVWIATQGDVMGASALLYAKLAAGQLEHDGAELLNLQAPRTVRKNVGDGFRISRKDSSIEIDGIMALALGVLAAETRTDDTLQVF
ncbi:terminase large subunit domain-containing protein [Agromyces archimandritae]|uniref:Terminase large subunit-like ATPase domain-containing protein n=1 Tax=Agromyces archimandritae TaxID=2781962 RepID=A0A975IN13_9MICO|nr:terminase large subunit [Agromyces archimandritae]QTX04118.1 hypothetical protein G127AT_12565 [Agromyces archimandritae]